MNHSPEIRKKLILLRHAEAEGASPAGGDAQRKLTPTGIEQCAMVRKVLDTMNFHRIFCSPALRTVDTLKLTTGLDTAATVVTIDMDLYSATTENYLEILATSETDIESVLVIGHNPGISAFATTLAGQPVSLSPAALVVLEIETDSWTAVGGATVRLASHWVPGRLEMENKKL